MKLHMWQSHFNLHDTSNHIPYCMSVMCNFFSLCTAPPQVQCEGYCWAARPTVYDDREYCTKGKHDGRIKRCQVFVATINTPQSAKLCYENVCGGGFFFKVGAVHIVPTKWPGPIRNNGSPVPGALVFFFPQRPLLFPTKRQTLFLVVRAICSSFCAISWLGEEPLRSMIRHRLPVHHLVDFWVPVQHIHDA